MNPEIAGYPGEAPEGANVGYLYLVNIVGAGTVGFSQVSAHVLAPNTTYTLSVEVGDQLDNSGFGLTGFPGYRIELRAGDSVLASDNNTLAPAEGTFETSTVAFTTGGSHPQLGMPLEIRLINILQAAGGEVDFDNVRLETSAVPSPVPALGPIAVVAVSLMLLGLGTSRIRRAGRGPAV